MLKMNGGYCITDFAEHRPHIREDLLLTAKAQAESVCFSFGEVVQGTRGPTFYSPLPPISTEIDLLSSHKLRQCFSVLIPQMLL